MTIPEARDIMKEIAQHNTQKILADFSPVVAELMLKSLAALTEATLHQCRENKDPRDCIITLFRMAMESDNASTILAKDATNSIFEGFK